MQDDVIEIVENIVKMQDDTKSRSQVGSRVPTWMERFAGLCTTRQLADGGSSIPPRSAILAAEYCRMMS